MMVPKVTLQGEVGTTRSFVIKGKFVKFRAQVPRKVLREVERRVRSLKQPNGKPLFKIAEVMVAELKGFKEKKVILPTKEVMQHVDGKEDAGWKQRKFLL